MSELRVETGFLQGGIYGAVGGSGSLYCILKTSLSLCACVILLKIKEWRFL